ncbi:MAG: hypothetical protein ACMZI0_14025 [Symbiopectobacterium sp.]|uniref:hypothetical protein n=1 Tax=Symbiopectobacterium sp. TaxID=2952789 RepID=UPI0039E97CFB
MQSLKNSHVFQCENARNITTFPTKFFLDKKLTDSDWENVSLSSPREKINHIFNSWEVYASSLGYRRKSHPVLHWSIALNIRNAEVDDKMLNNIFMSFNCAYDENITMDRFLVAFIAVKARDFWCEMPPEKLKKEDIVKCVSQYSELFSVGEVVKNIIKEV